MLRVQHFAGGGGESGHQEGRGAHERAVEVQREEESGRTRYFDENMKGQGTNRTQERKDLWKVRRGRPPMLCGCAERRLKEDQRA